MPITPDRPDGRSAGSEDPLEAAEATDDAAHPKARRPSRETGWGYNPTDEDFDLVRETVPVATRPATPRDQDAASHDQDATPHDQDQPTVRVEPADRRAERDRETVRLPRQRKPADSRKRPPLLVAAAFATMWAALLSYLPVALVIGLARTLEGQGGLLPALHAGLAGWLLGHGVPVWTSIGPLGLAPLLLTLLAGWRLNRAGLHVTRAVGARRSGSPGRALTVALAVGVSYGLLGLLAAVVVDGRGTDVWPPRAGLNLLVAGFVFALLGSLRGTDALVVVARRLPPPVRHGVRTGVVAVLLILAAGAAFAGLSVAMGGGDAADMIAAYRTGVAGQAGITLLSLAYGANATVWAAAYLLGPGFALGVDSDVRLTELSVDKLPTLPLLAGLPTGPMGASGALLLAVPVLAAMAAGWLLSRRLMGVHHVVESHLTTGRQPVRSGDPMPQEPAWSLVLGSAVLAGPVAGLMFGALSWLSSGPLGDGRMARIGPVPWQVALVAAAVVGVCACIGAAAARAFRAPVPK